jgi:hypothetical protein
MTIGAVVCDCAVWRQVNAFGERAAVFDEAGNFDAGHG